MVNLNGINWYLLKPAIVYDETNNFMHIVNIYVDIYVNCINLPTQNNKKFTMGFLRDKQS